jgi:very-short-patch-repair endonuclease
MSVVERHRQRRAQGVPTVTVLAGDRRVAAWLWRSMPAMGGHAWVVAHGSEQEAVVAQWMGSAEVRSALRASILALMAADAQVSSAEFACQLAARSPWQLEQLAERTSAAHGLALSTIRSALGLQPDSAQPAVVPDILRQTERLLGRVPPVLVEPDAGSPDGLRHAATTVVNFAEALPRADIGLLLGNASLDTLRSRVSDRIATVLNEGLVALTAHSTAPAHTVRSAAGVPVEYDAQAFARSRAELKLFETLHARSRTAGLFKLNQKIDACDGGAPLEIDLLSDSLRLAVEVDGYHHFRDAHGYRRDRRKDVLLQHLGYVVLRVLASDVESELQHVLEIIDAAVERRKRRPA